MPKKKIAHKSTLNRSAAQTKKGSLTSLTLGTLILAASLLTLLNFLYKKPGITPSELPASATSLTSPKSTTYIGTLPCADCSGITTEVTFSNDKSYQIHMTYIGKNDEKPLTTSGAWEIINNPNAGKGALTYKLTPHESSESTQYYLLTENGALQELDGNMQILSSPGMNFTLLKKN